MDHDRPPQPPIPEARTVLLPEFKIPTNLRDRYHRSITQLAADTTIWDQAVNKFTLKPTAPHLFIAPLRSGPIAKSGYDEYCMNHDIPQPPTIEVTGIGSETRNTFIAHLQMRDPQFDPDDWENADVQEQFRSWIKAAENPMVAQAIDHIKAKLNNCFPDKTGEFYFMFVDDTGGEYGDVRNRVTPAILDAAMEGRPYRYKYHLMFPKQYFDERLWYDQIIEETFGRSLPFPQREFLCEAVRGGFDDLYQRSDILQEFRAELRDEQGNYNLQSIDRLRILGTILQRNTQDLNEIAYPGQFAENGFDPLFKKYGINLLHLKSQLVDVLRAEGRRAPSLQKS